jgi:dTDP-4-amino-4,6-dideoxy-D-galactose acyltransferase
MGRPVYSLRGAPAGLTFDDLPHGDAFISAKVDVADKSSLQTLKNIGFERVETLVTMQRPSTPMAPAGGSARFARASDVGAVRAIARRAFVFDRFHADPEIGPAIASRVKEEWAANFFAGKRGDWMVVGEDEGGVVGFLQLLKGPSDELVIDLIAVCDRHSGKGIARAMIGFAYENCLGRPVSFRVGTQEANAKALALYQKLGFRRAFERYTLHKHQTSAPL